jgi:hypothetical protein
MNSQITRAGDWGGQGVNKRVWPGAGGIARRCPPGNSSPEECGQRDRPAHPGIAAANIPRENAFRSAGAGF